MKISMWSNFLPEFSPEAAVEALLAAGYGFGELSSEHGAMLLERGGAAAVGREFGDFCARRGFAFPQAHFDLAINLAEPDAAYGRRAVDHLRRECDLYLALGVTAGVIHGCCLPPGRYHRLDAATDGIVAARLGELLTHTRGTPLTVCLENLVVNYPTLDELLRLAALAPGGERLGVCFDTGHHIRTGGGAMSVFVRRAGTRLKALHIADCVGDTCDHLLPWLGGRGDWPDLLAALRETGYDGAFNFEIPRLNRTPLAIRLATLAFSRRLADAMLAPDAAAVPSSRG